MGQGVHDRPGNIGMARGVGTRCAVGNLPATRGAALDGQEGLSDVVPAGIPFDPAPLNRVLRFEYERVFRFEAVVNRGRARVKIAHQVKHSVANAGGIDTDVLHVETLGKFLDLLGLVLERLPTPAVLFQNPELGTRLQRWGNDHATGVVAGTAGVVSDPHGAVTEGAGFVGIVVRPQGQVGVAAFQIRQGKGALSAVDKLAHEQLFKFVAVKLQPQLLQVEPVTTAGDRVEDGDDLAPLTIGAAGTSGNLFFAWPGIFGAFVFAIAKLLARPKWVGLVRHRAWC